MQLDFRRGLPGLIAGVTGAGLTGIVVWALATLPPPRPRAAATPAAGDPPTLAGAFHIHTNRSDGSGSPDEVAAAAGRAGLDFIILTDHGDGMRPPDPPAYRSGVLVLDGVELSTSGGHYAVLDLAAAPYPLGGEARDVVEDVGRLGGFGVVTHPGSPKPALRWEDWSLPVDAFEWLNADSEWRDEGWMTLARGLLQYFVRPVETLASLLDRPDPVLEQWDRLTAIREVVAMAGVDAHARIQLGLGGEDGYARAPHIAVPSYERSFRGFSLRVPVETPLTGDPARDRDAVLSAVKRGRVYTVVDGLAAAPSLAFHARQGEARVGMGERLDAPAGEAPIVFDVSVGGPSDAEIVLLRNGQVATRARGTSLSYTSGADPGAYRVEVYLVHTAPAMPWILSNPIYVGPAAAVAPPPAVRPAGTIPIDVATAWAIERDAESSGVLEIAGAAADELGITYTLGAGRDASPYVAVSHEWPAGAGAGDALTFIARADRPLRLSVQLRAPGSPEAQRWRRSIYLGPDATLARVRFDDMTPVDGSPERPDLDRVDAILFVADTSNAEPGSTASVWLSDIRVEEF